MAGDRAAGSDMDGSTGNGWGRLAAMLVALLALGMVTVWPAVAGGGMIVAEAAMSAASADDAGAGADVDAREEPGRADCTARAAQAACDLCGEAHCGTMVLPTAAMLADAGWPRVPSRILRGVLRPGCRSGPEPFPPRRGRAVWNG